MRTLIGGWIPKLIATTALIAGVCTAALATDGIAVPEIAIGNAMAAASLIAGAILVFRGGRK